MTQLDITRPESVLAHALQRRARHRRPSAIYRRYGRTITNPREALRAAAEDLLEADAGEHISHYCARLSDIAPLFARLGADKRFADQYTPGIFDSARGAPRVYGAAIGRFNDIYLSVEPTRTKAAAITRAGYRAFEGDTGPEELDVLYGIAIEARYQDYHASPEGTRAREQHEAEVLEQAEECVNLIEALRNNYVDVKNLSSVLAWWYCFTRVADFRGVTSAAAKFLGTDTDGLREEAVAFFTATGFEADAEIIDGVTAETAELLRREIGDSEERSARYIVGQCLSMIKSQGCPHPVAMTFIERWYFRFKYLPALLGITKSNPKFDPIYVNVPSFEDATTLREQLHDVIDRIGLATAGTLLHEGGIKYDLAVGESPKSVLTKFIDKMLAGGPNDFEDED